MTGKTDEIADSVHQDRTYVCVSDEKAVSSRVERYSYHDNRWEPLRPISVPRFFGYLISFKDHLYLVGGATLDDAGNIVCISEIEQ